MEPNQKGAGFNQRPFFLSVSSPACVETAGRLELHARGIDVAVHAVREEAARGGAIGIAAVNDAQNLARRADDRQRLGVIREVLCPGWRRHEILRIDCFGLGKIQAGMQAEVAGVLRPRPQECGRRNRESSCSGSMALRRRKQKRLRLQSARATAMKASWLSKPVPSAPKLIAGLAMGVMPRPVSRPPDQGDVSLLILHDLHTGQVQR